MNIELNIKDLPDVFFDANQDKYCLRDGDGLSIYSFITHSCEKTISFGARRFFKSKLDDSYLYVSKELERNKSSKIIKLNLETYDCAEVSEAPFSYAIEQGVSEGWTFSKSRNGLYKSRHHDDKNIEFIPISHAGEKIHNVGFFGRGFIGFLFDQNQICFIDEDGNYIWRKDISEYSLLRNSTLASSFFCDSGKAFSVTYDYELICIRLDNGCKIWSFQGCSSVATKLYKDRIYSFYKGSFLVIDADTGKLVSSERIGLGIDNSEQDDLTLFQLLVTDTHAWCAFLGGRGLQAINLETFDVDWSGFEGRTLNVPPQLRNNYMFLNFMDGGIGIGENSGSSNFMLEGVGGYDVSAGKDKFYLS